LGIRVEVVFPLGKRVDYDEDTDGVGHWSKRFRVPRIASNQHPQKVTITLQLRDGASTAQHVTEFTIGSLHRARGQRQKTSVNARSPQPSPRPAARTPSTRRRVAPVEPRRLVSKAPRSPGPIPPCRYSCVATVSVHPARPSPTFAPAPNPTVLLTVRPEPNPTARPLVRLRLFVTPSVGLGQWDPATGVQISLLHAVMVTPGRGRSRPPLGHIWLLLEVSLVDAKKKAAFSQNDFFTVTVYGQTLSARLTDPTRRSLGSGRLKAGASIRGWIGFTLPTLPTSGTVTWNDHNHLIPPTVLLKYRLRAA
jgi:hypothetical protein